MDDVYENVKKCKGLTVFDDMIVDIISNEKLNPIVTEIFIRERNLKISLGFIAWSHFTVPKNIRLNSKNYSILKVLL